MKTKAKGYGRLSPKTPFTGITSAVLLNKKREAKPVIMEFHKGLLVGIESPAKPAPAPKPAPSVPRPSPQPAPRPAPEPSPKPVPQPAPR